MEEDKVWTTKLIHIIMRSTPESDCYFYSFTSSFGFFLATFRAFFLYLFLLVLHVGSSRMVIPERVCVGCTMGFAHRKHNEIVTAAITQKMRQCMHTQNIWWLWNNCVGTNFFLLFLCLGAHFFFSIVVQLCGCVRHWTLLQQQPMFHTTFFVFLVRHFSVAFFFILRSHLGSMASSSFVWKLHKRKNLLLVPSFVLERIMSFANVFVCVLCVLCMHLILLIWLVGFNYVVVCCVV